MGYERNRLLLLFHPFSSVKAPGEKRGRKAYFHASNVFAPLIWHCTVVY